MAVLFNRIIAAIIRAPRVQHPDGKVFVRLNDRWLPV